MAVDYKALKGQGFMKQVQKDHFSMRLKVVGGNLRADQLAAIAEISTKYGDGYVHLTSRQGVEIPFIKLEEIDAVNAAVEEKGLCTAACGAQVRTITACQGRQICSSGCIDTYPLALELSERYSKRQLPHKFKLGVTGCKNNCLKAEENDIGIKGGYVVSWLPELCTLCGLCVKGCGDGALSKTENEIVQDKSKCTNCGRCVKVCPFKAWAGEPGYLLSFGGTFGRRIIKGEQFLPIITDKETLFRVTDTAVQFFEQNAEKGERFRSSLERLGLEDFKAKIEAAYRG